MITPPPGARVWLAAGFTDMRKGFDGLAMLVQEKLKRDPFGGQVFVFRGRRGYLLKAYGGTARACAFTRSDWRRGGSFGLRQRTGAWC
jgi:transposase